MKRKWIIGTCAILLVLLLFASYMAVAAETSKKGDPLVELSYLTDILAPETIEKVNEAISLKTDEMEQSINLILSEYTTQLEQTIEEFETRNKNIATDSSFISAVTASVMTEMEAGGGVPGVSGGGSGWQLVQVTSGETYKFAVGGMVLLRIGEAKCYTPSSPGIIDCTEGSELDGGKALEKNHLYMITVAERGFTATSDAKIMVYGSYTVG